MAGFRVEKGTYLDISPVDPLWKFTLYATTLIKPKCILLLFLFYYTQGWPEPFIYFMYECMYGSFLTRLAYTPCTHINVWFWPTLNIIVQQSNGLLKC